MTRKNSHEYDLKQGGAGTKTGSDGNEVKSPRNGELEILCRSTSSLSRQVRGGAPTYESTWDQTNANERMKEVRPEI
jgi:hypothetical protein